MNKTMKKRTNKRPPIRKIHINLPEDVHQKLRVKCALQDVTIQEFVEALIVANVADVFVGRTVGEEER